MPKKQGSVATPPVLAGKQLAGAGMPLKAADEVDGITKKLSEIALVQEGKAPEAHAVAKSHVDDDGKPAADDEVPRRIKIETLTGRVIEVYMQPTDAVGRIKERVEEKEGIPPEHQRLILRGKQLADDKTVRESKITAGCVIHLVLALRGGRCN